MVMVRTKGLRDHDVKAKVKEDQSINQFIFRKTCLSYKFREAAVGFVSAGWSQFTVNRN